MRHKPREGASQGHLTSPPLTWGDVFSAVDALAWSLRDQVCQRATLALQRHGPAGTAPSPPRQAGVAKSHPHRLSTFRADLAAAPACELWEPSLAALLGDLEHIVRQHHTKGFCSPESDELWNVTAYRYISALLNSPALAALFCRELRRVPGVWGVPPDPREVESFCASLSADAQASNKRRKDGARYDKARRGVREVLRGLAHERWEAGERFCDSLRVVRQEYEAAACAIEILPAFDMGLFRPHADGIQVMQRMYEDAECFIDVCEIPSLSTRPVSVKCFYAHTYWGFHAFAREATAHARVQDHPLFPRVLAAGMSVTKGQAVLVTSFVPEIRKMQAGDGRDAPSLYDLQPAIQMCLAVSELHRLGVGHYKICLDRFYMEGMGYKLGDLSYASYAHCSHPRYCPSAPSLQQRIPTTAHQSSYDGHAGHFDASADVYGLAVSVYSKIVGQHPLTYDGKDLGKLQPQEAWEVVYHGQAVPDIATWLPPYLQDLLTRALSNDPAQRPTAFELYAAVQDMRADLGTWQEAKHQADREELRKYEETRPPYVMSARVAALFQAWQRWLDEQAEGGKGDESAQAESSTRNTTPMSTPRPMNTPKALEHTTPVGTPRSDSDEPPQDAL